MSDVLEVLKKASEVLKKEGHADLVSEIDEAMKNPEMSIPVPKGKLQVGICNGESTQAFVGLDNEELGTVNLFLAECMGEELREIHSGVEEGDICMYIWEDISNEDYTRTSTITRREIEAQEEYVRDY